MLFVNCRHLGLRQSCFPPTGSNRSLAKAGQNTNGRAAKRSISQMFRTYHTRYLGGTIDSNTADIKGTDRRSANNEYPIGTISVICFCFHQFTPLRRVHGLQCSAYDQDFVYKSDAF